MALSATIHRVDLTVSDLNRDVYVHEELRVAQHPSENLRFLLARVVGYALLYDDGIAFGRGVSTADEPAIWIRSPSGEVKVWADVGRPSPSRLHRASKLADRVVVLCHAGVDLLLGDLAKSEVHRRDELEVLELPSGLLDELEQQWSRSTALNMTFQDDSMYVTLDEASFEGRLIRHRLQ